MTVDSRAHLPLYYKMGSYVMFEADYNEDLILIYCRFLSYFFLTPLLYLGYGAVYFKARYSYFKAF